MNKELLINNLEKHGFIVKYFDMKEDATKYISDSIKDKTVAIGGSLTALEMGLDKELSKNNEVIWHWDKDLVEKHGVKKVRDMGMNTDIYITSVNGVSETGSLVNIDGTGNRIASTLYGHEKVYFIIGENKIEPSLEKAMWRARNIAAPKNAQRLNRKTPCAVKGDKCYDCNSPERICRGFLTIDRAMSSMEMEVIIVGESLGL